MSDAPGADDDLTTRLAEQRELGRRHRDTQIELSGRQAAVLARSAEIHDEVARVHETLPHDVLRVSPQQARDHAALDRERSAEETRHAEDARARRAEDA